MLSCCFSDSSERGATSPQVRPQPPLPYQPCLGPITQGPTCYPAPTVSYSSTPQGTQVTWAGSMPPGQAPPIMMQSGSGGPGGGSGSGGGNIPIPTSGPVMYIAPNIESVPPGSVLINPQTSKSFFKFIVNPDKQA